MKVIEIKKGKELVFLSIALRVVTFAACITVIALNDMVAVAWIGCQILFSLMILFESKETKKMFFDEIDDGENINWFTETMIVLMAAPAILVLLVKFVIIPEIKKKMKGEEEEI